LPPARRRVYLQMRAREIRLELKEDPKRLICQGSARHLQFEIVRTRSVVAATCFNPIYVAFRPADCERQTNARGHERDNLVSFGRGFLKALEGLLRLIEMPRSRPHFRHCRSKMLFLLFDSWPVRQRVTFHRPLSGNLYIRFRRDVFENHKPTSSINVPCHTLY
jgi:hypothetical protein